MSDPKCHEARKALGEMLKLVEDGVLVRNTKEDGDFMKYAQQSMKLTAVLVAASEALK